MYLSWILKLVLPLLLTMFPLPVVAQIIVVALRSLAKRTKNTTDDEMVKVLERYFNVPPEEIKEVKDEADDK